MVRKMHAASHRTMNRSHPKPQTNELWMSQFYMATTQISFVGLMMICPKAVGLGHLSEADKEAIMHYWRCIGELIPLSPSSKEGLARPLRLRDWNSLAHSD